ncbi:heavy-metal-associated domain-containing protein [Nitrosomonas sp.]|uniref:heavy-metal-associated domain-containing protein n=1 Tax=Nitrosomonas sp. TaxID=42353 RepID=UPI002082A5A3|nr:cation transporter [Nitrosomonas sp.]GJL75974.1 MAG: mercury ion transport protein periplasmic component MerP [Nitrosomonas sp.]
MKRTSLILSSLAMALMLAVGSLIFLTSAQAEKSNVQKEAVAEQTVTFTIEKMTCAACPITVRKAMESVDGVKSVSMDFKAKTATVIFDSSVTSVQKIGAASTNAGYPASPVS